MLLEHIQQTEFRAGYNHFWSQFSFMIDYILQVAYPRTTEEQQTTRFAYR